MKGINCQISVVHRALSIILVKFVLTTVLMFVITLCTLSFGHFSLFLTISRDLIYYSLPMFSYCTQNDVTSHGFKGGSGLVC